MSDSTLSCLEIGASRDEAELCVLLMHGLGANAHDFEDVAIAISEAAKPRRWRFVLPNAPEIPVTINMGMIMPAWYDILDLSHPREVNWDSVAQSQIEIEALLAKESTEKIVLAGFSQGAAMALHVGLRHQNTIAGILLMSGYLLESKAHPCPEKNADFPIAILHGSEDPMIPLTAARQTEQSLSEKTYSPTMKVYPGMPHSVCDEEIRDVFEWLDRIDPA